MSVVGSNERLAILMIAIGARPWSRATSELFRDYAKKCGATFILQTEEPSEEEFPLPAMPDEPGRAHKRVYALKAFLPWRLMAVEGYDRVLVVDDSCCVKHDAPNVFDFVEQGGVGLTGTSHAHAELSFKDIRKYLKARGEPAITYDPEYYMNSGVMVYTRGMADAISPDRILAAREMLFAWFPHQTLTYYLLNSAKVPQTLLPKAFNRLPASTLAPEEWVNMTDATPYLSDDDDTYIYHVTGAFKRRDALIPSLALHLLAQTDPDRARAVAATIPPPSDIAVTPPAAPSIGKRIARKLRSLVR